MHPKALLDACSELVRLVLRFEHPADAVISRYFKENRHRHAFGPRERATLAETAYAVLRRKLLFEALSQSGSGPKERRLAILGFHGPRDFLMSALNDVEKDWLKACDTADPSAPESGLLDMHRHNLPHWLVAPLREQLHDEFWPLAESLERPAPLDLRVNTVKAKRSAIQSELSAAGIAAEVTPFSPWGLRVQGKPALNKLDAYTNGAIEVQEEGSQLIAMLLDARRGEMVADFCAGAGGKTLAIGATMRNTGRLYAFDTSAHRLAAFGPRLARSGLSNVHPAAIAHERDERIKRLSGKFDRVLVDAPCSGLGTLRRNPDLKWRQNEQSVRELSVKQRAILEAAARLLKPGGRLVYATCSVLPDENEAIAESFGVAHPDFTALPVQALLEALGMADAGRLCSGPYLRLWPHRHATDGFFAAVWQRN